MSRTQTAPLPWWEERTERPITRRTKQVRYRKAERWGRRLYMIDGIAVRQVEIGRAKAKRPGDYAPVKVLSVSESERRAA